MRSNNLSQVRVDMMSDADIQKVKNELTKTNTSLEQAESIALSKGMSPVEFNKLKQRLNSVPPASTGVVEEESKVSFDKEDDTQPKKAREQASSLVFGSELFNNPSLTFEPNLKLATPLNYILGPGDELHINIYGVQEYNATMPITSEGRITLQNVGPINIAGMTFEAAVQAIRQAMSKTYSTLQSGQSQIAVSLSKIRTIKITIIGSMQPGNYSVSSLATVFNALHLAGGPAANGSYRNIELIRNNKVERKIDIYRFLVNGDQSDNAGLKDNDVIRIPPYSNRVTVEGEAKRPGIFELLPKETFKNLLQYCSGFTEDAYRSGVKLIQKTGKEMKVMDLFETDFGSYQPQSGDVFRFTKILNRYENRVTLNGAVFRPDIYALSPGLTISKLLSKAEGLKEDAYRERATIVRLKEDLTQEIINVDLRKVLNGDKTNDLELKREDIITVYSILDLKNNFVITIDGEIRKPGKYPFVDKITLNDLIIEAGGISDAASKRVEIARMIKSEDSNKENNLEIINVEINPANIEQSKNIELKPFDNVNIRKMPVYYTPDMITISGAVQFPGKYAMTNKKENIFDLLNRAGGFTPEADQNGVMVKRKPDLEKIKAAENINIKLKADSNFNNMEKINTFITIPVEYNKIKKNKKSKANIVLFAGDEIIVAHYAPSVKVTGNVLLSSQIPYSGRGVRYYLNSVGGTNDRAWKQKIYVVYSNGRAATTKNFLLFKNYPKVEPGAQIIVPTRPERKRMATGEVVGIASVLTSLAGIVIAILR